MRQYLETASDKNVRGVEFYLKKTEGVADGYLYLEADCENKADKETLVHAFEMNNAVIVDGDSKYRAIFLTADPDEEYCSLTYITAVTAEDTTTATITVVYSSEYSAE